MKKSIGTNAILNTIKTAMSVIFPLLTFPYVSKTLDVASLGKYNFAYSLNSYFLMFAALGISSYAVREGAALREDRKLLSEFASQVFTLNMISMIVSYILMFLSILFIPQFQTYTAILIIFSIEILFTTLGVEWIYIIYEEYAYITIRRIIFQFISMVLLFLLVKNENDLIIYAGITVFANVGANIINIIQMKKYCDIRITKKTNFIRHIKPIIIIFASTIAIKIYTSSDTIMLGIFSGDYEVGLYSVGVKVYNVMKTLLAAIFVVAIPRLSSYVGRKMMREYNEMLITIFKSLFVLILPTITGLIILSDNIILFLSNESYMAASTSLKMLSVAILFSIYSSFYNQCVLIPLKKEKFFLYATVISAIVNVLMNFYLIPRYGQNGAALTTVMSEAISFLICYLAGRKSVKMTGLTRNMVTSLCGCLGITVVCLFVKELGFSNNITIITSIITSGLIYGMLLSILKNDLFLIVINKISSLRINRSST